MKAIREILTYVVIVLIVIFIRMFIITPVIVNGDSMKQTLFNKDVLLLNKAAMKIKRFDIIVLNYDGDRLVKRVIGLPGEHIKYVNNQLYVNGDVVEETYLDSTTVSFDINQMGYDIIPDNSYFVLGDNRINSKDSRFFGAVPAEEVIGKTKFRLYPLKKIGIIK